MSPIRPKDFTLLKRDGVYHCFYIRHDPTKPASQSQIDLGHSTSLDMFVWTHRASVIPIRPGEFDRSHVWAPHIVERDGLYYMFFTGVAVDEVGGANYYQRMGLAVSSDLETWTRMDDPVLSPPGVPWALSDSTNAWAAFRDPFVMPDPTSPGRWLMYYSAVPASAPSGVLVGVAASNGDFTQWTDLMPLWNTHVSMAWHVLTESPHVFQHGSLWYLLCTSEFGQPILIQTSTSPIAGSSLWTNRGSLSAMLGYDTSSWYASEYFRDGLNEYLAYVNGDWLEFKRIVWSAGWQFSLAEPDPFHVVGLSWGRSSVTPGELVPVRFATRWGYGRNLAYDVVGHDLDGQEHIYTPETFGLPPTIAVSADTMTLIWSATEPFMTPLGVPVTQLTLRTKDLVCESDPIELLADPVPPEWNPLPPPPVPIPTDGGDGDVIIPRLRRASVRLAGAGVELVAELRAATAVRIDVFDLQGRRLRRLRDGVLPAGANVLHWDGRDEAGVAASRGLYFARLTTERGARTLRLTLP